MDGETKLVKVFLDPKKFKTVEVMMITDLQFGNIAFKEDRFLEFRDWNLSQPNRFVLLGGDIIDAATPLSVQSPFENKWQPSDQVKHLVDIMAPLASRILGYVGGNHERRTSKTFGDAGSLIATLLRVKYSRGIQLIDIYYGEHKPFKISLWHGTGAARTKGARLNMVHRFMQQGDSQLYLCGHLHDVVATYDWRQHREGDKIKLLKIAGVMSSSFLEYWNTFGEVVGLPASDTMMARCIIEPSGKWEVTLR
jgi:predicted MPP superfamily phosphohydrolase